MGIALSAWLTLSFWTTPARALIYPWVLLEPEHDSRDPDMIDSDRAHSQNLVAIVGASEKIFDHHLVWCEIPIRKLLSISAPFCELHFDAIHQLTLTAEEKQVLKEYIKRGGFLLCFIDAYPYSEDQYWPVKQWNFIDFLTHELPASDPGFTVGRATDAFPIFSFYYKTRTADAIRHEFAGNPNTPNRTLLFYRGRLCVFVMGDYGYFDGAQWVPLDRPFPRSFSTDPKSYELMVNIYAYSIAH